MQCRHTCLQESSALLAPTEQPPRKLSGKRTVNNATLWREAHAPTEGEPGSCKPVKLSGTVTDGVCRSCDLHHHYRRRSCHVSPSSAPTLPASLPLIPWPNSAIQSRS